ncbi:MAG: glycoside hydrolase family 88 protein, partial [Duncaniella sp.]|nr:glycoside hydrolase family 88 protein [Duncaniella sp.]
MANFADKTILYFSFKLSAMKKFTYILLVILILLPLTATTAEKLPARQDVLKTLTKVNDKYLRDHPDPLRPIPYYSRKKIYDANLWTRAVYFEGLMSLYSIYPENKLLDYATEWADGFKWGMKGDITTTRNADNYCCAQTYIDLYRLCPE